MGILEQLKKDLDEESIPAKAKDLRRFFKTKKGEYGEGDVFIGVNLPSIRNIARRYMNISFEELQELLNSHIHEYRLVALILLVEKYKNLKSYPEKRKIFEFYLKNTKRVNNWDLVDASAPYISGDFLYNDKSYDTLRILAKSENIWERRIAIVSTYAFIKNNNLGETLVIADILLKDDHDLIQKAVGWMLREVGKKNKRILELFLASRYKEMPRTMLRYAIEKFPKEERNKYLKGEI